jgi:hypothetical protein
MLNRTILSVAFAIGLSLPVHAATSTQTVSIDTFALSEISDTADVGPTVRWATIRQAFAAFDSSLGMITGATLTVQENYSLRSTVVGEALGRNSTRSDVTTFIRLGNNRNTQLGHVTEALNNVMHVGAWCVVTGPSCSASSQISVSDAFRFSFDAERANDLFLNERDFVLRVGRRTLLRSSAGLATASFFDASYDLKLDVEYAPQSSIPAVPLPASGILLAGALGSLALARRRKARQNS